METEFSDQTGSEEQSHPSNRRNPRTVIKVLLLVVVLGLALLGGYIIGKSQYQTTPKAVQQTTIKTNKKSAVSVHFVKSVGTPLDTLKQLTVSFGIPSDYQAVLGSDGDFTSTFLSTSFNNIIGSWYIGEPSATTPESSSASIVAIDKDWLNGGPPLVVQPDNNTESYWKNVEDSYACPYALFGCHIQSGSERQKYLTDLENKIASCAKDSTRGFSTRDGVFQACFTYHDSENDSRLPLTIYGLGKVNGQSLVLTASISFSHNTHGSDLAAWAQHWIRALEQTTVKS